MLFRITFIIGYGGSLIPTLVSVLKDLEQKYRFEYKIITPYRFSEKDIPFIKQSDLVFIYSHKLPDEIENILEKIRSQIKVIGIDENHIHLTNTSNYVLDLAMRYLKYGGKENLYLLVLLLLREIGYRDIEPASPKELPWHSIYHPCYGVFNSIMEYFKEYPYSRRPLVGILFYRSDWIYGRTVIVDKLIEKLENIGLGVVTVFTYSFRDKFLNTPHTEDSIKEFFFLNGKPIIDALVNLTSFFITDHGPSREWAKTSRLSSGLEILKKLNVPIIQCLITYSKTLDEWLRDPRGVDYMTIVYRIIMPEIDGAIEPIIVSCSKIDDYGGKQLIPIDDHIEYVASRIGKWIELRMKKPWKRKVAIILMNPPCKGLEANVAIGLGLDVPESIVSLLHRLKQEGYYVGEDLPRNGEELIKIIMSKKAISEFRWTSVEEIVSRGGALDFVDAEKYLKWFLELPPNVRKAMVEEWGDPESILSGRDNHGLAGMVFRGKFVVPGLRFGNIVLIPQPKRGCTGSRCDGRVCKILHNPIIPPPHQWLAVYRWITRVFRADVIIHFGTHGYLEFLPGKHVGLSWMCWPEISIDNVPHLYVYVVSNPMEGVVAKRRSYATIIDHLYPVSVKADVLDDIDSLLSQHIHAKSVGDHGRANVIYKQLIEMARKYNIPITDDTSEEEVIETIHKYVHLTRNTIINMGLHVLGSPPSDPRLLAEYIIAILNYRSNDRPSIKEIIARYVGINYNDLLKKPFEVNRVYKRPNRELLEIIHKITIDTLKDIIDLGKTDRHDILGILRNYCIKYLGKEPHIVESIEDHVLEIINYGLYVAELIKKCRQEIDQLIKGLAGKYIEPGPSGALYRGRVDVLPTGRNFYLVDPRTLPTKAAWEIGRTTAELLLKYYLEKHGRYPESVGEVLWSIDAYKADGEQLAQILYLLGVEPVWDETGVVKDVRVIPLEELGRPRIDVVIRISGIVRDTLPNYIMLLDKAVAKVVSLDEPIDMNYVRRHYLENLKNLMEMGIEPEKAMHMARYRVYGAPPGAYGVGVNLAVEASAWKNGSDLAKVWLQWSGYAYGSNSHGEPAFEALAYSLKNVDIINRNHISDEHDILNCCCYFAYHGGFYNAVKSLTNRDDIEIVTVDTRDPLLADIRSMELEIERSVRSKLLNKEWIEEMKKHGYRGASEFQRKILHLYGWASTTRLVKDWIFNKIADTYVVDEEMRKWFIQHNVWALEEITRRLIEAAVRGVWKAPRELIEKLRRIYSEIEGILEEDIAAPSNIQGGSIDIVSPDQITSWSKALSKVEAIWNKISRESSK